MKTPIHEHQLQTIFLFILSLIAIAFALYWLRPVMIPFILAIFGSFILTPVIEFQIKYLKFPRVLSLITTLLIGCFFLVVVWLLVWASVNQLIANSASYQEKIERMFSAIVNALNFERFGTDAKTVFHPLLQDIGQNVGGFLAVVINTIFGLLSRGLLVIIFIGFLLLGETRSRPAADSVWSEAEPHIKRYIRTKILISMITGFIVGLTLFLLNVDLALVFGLLAFVLNFIPSIGSIIATLLPIPVVIFSPDISLLAGIMAITIPAAVQFTVGNVLEPKIMGHSLDLHPIAILMALIFWGMIWGIVGMFLAVPLTSMMKIIFERTDMTRPLANLLAGRIS